MPSFEWLKFKEGKTSGIPQKFQEFPNPFCLVSQKRMHDICMLLDARMILEWAFHSTLIWRQQNGQNEGRCTSGMLEILMVNLP